MSYDINLYQVEFLKRAVAQSMGDWTGAPVLPEVVRSEIKSAAIQLGFRDVPQDPRFVAFAAAQGHAVAEELTLDTTDVLAQLMLFKNSVTFLIPASGRAPRPIERCLGIARSMASSHGLGLYDPQTGELGG